jgi:GH25 family lysozyme M1 (1,4-beta-N-acetylmuramidase)
MNPYVIGVDVWEGNEDVDPQALVSGGVGFVIIRISDINGGLHLDANFKSNWDKFSKFPNLVKWVYTVFNPWVDGAANFAWLAANMPPDATHVSVDVEVRWSGRAPGSYAAELCDFLDLAEKHWSVDIYTGGGFADLCSTWPVNVNYWWARYPYGFWYPTNAVATTWEQVQAQAALTPWAPGQTPGPCRLWQISGDRLKPPGCVDRAVDVNLWNGTLDELRAYAGQTAPVSPAPVAQTWQQAIDAWARSQPQPYAGPKP